MRFDSVAPTQLYCGTEHGRKRPTMPNFRPFTILIAAMIGVSALAIDGPTPLAWRWSARTTFAPSATPAVSNGTVFVPVGKKVYALDSVWGTPKWVFPTVDNTVGDYRTSVAVAGDNIIVANTAKFVFALDRKTGSRVWTFLDVAATRHILVSGDTAFLFTTDDRIVAINAKSGQKEWVEDFVIGDNLTGEPALADGNLVFFTSIGNLVCVNTSTKKKAWTVRLGSINVDGGPFVFDGSIWIVTGPQVAKINTRTGAVVGRPMTFPERLSASVVVTKRGGVVVGNSNKIYVFDSTGRTFSRTPLEMKGYLSGSPVVAGENIIVKNRAGAMLLIDPSRQTNPIVWEYTTVPIAGTMRSTTASSGSAGAPSAGGGALSPGGAQGGGASAGGTARLVPAESIAIIGNLVEVDGSLFALAEDGSVLAWSWLNGVDETGPTIKMIAPTMGATMSGQPDLDIIFKLEDDGAGIMSRSIRVKMNGADFKTEFVASGGWLYVKIRTPGSRAEGANPPLTDGRKSIMVTVTDWMGNVSEKSFFLLIDNLLPVVRPVAPASSGSGGRPGG